MTRYAIGITYPNGKKGFNEYRSYAENKAHFDEIKDFWKAKGCKVALIKYERCNGSSYNFKIVEEA